MATWDTASTPNTGAETINASISLGNGKFVCVGSNGTVLTSDDSGVTWLARTAAAANNWVSLAYDGTTVVAVSSNGASRVMTSTNDGETWASHTAAAANTWQSVTYASFISTGMFIAVSSDGANRVMTSVDSGANWTSQSAATASAWGAVVASDALVLAYAPGATGGAGEVMTSTNGTAWSAGTSTADIFAGSGTNGAVLVFSAASGNFAVAGWSFPGTIPFPANTGMFATTPDGATWTYSAASPLNTYFSLFGLVAADEIDGYIGSLPALSDFTPTPTIIGYTDDQAVTWTDEDTTFSSTTWSCGAWDGDTGTVIFWDSAQTNTMLVGTFDVSSLTGVSPATGTRLGGTVVTLTGTGLTGVVTGDVLFDASAALSVVVAGDGLSLTCITPAHAVGAVDVTITGVGTLASAYTYVAVDSVSPNRGTFQGGTAVTITGFGFDNATGVTFDGISLGSIVYVSNTTITGTTPVHGAGSVDVVVIGVGTLTAGYTYEVPLLKAPPQPYYSGLQQEGNSPRIEAGWSRWLDTIAGQAYNPTLGPASIVPAGNVVGVLAPANIPDISYTKIQMSAPYLLGRTTAGTGDAEQIAVVGGLVLDNGFLSIFGLLGGFTIGDILYANSANTLATLADVSVGSYLRSGGVATAPLWSTLKLPNAATVGAVVFATATNTYGEDATNFLWNNTTNVLEIAAGTVVDGNLGIGSAVFAALTSGGANALANTAVGWHAMTAATTTRYSTAIGYNALAAVTTARYNTAIGSLTLQATTGASNTAIGAQVLMANTTGEFNVGLGGGDLAALLSNVDGSQNMAIGADALRLNVSGSNNVAVGVAALERSTASNNIGIGHLAGQVITSGSGNTVIGASAGLSLTTGIKNIVIGSSTVTGPGVSTGSNNTIIGGEISGLSTSLASNVILATGDGTIRAQFDGSNWALNAASFPSTGTAGLVFPDGTALASMASNTAAIYANDVAGTVKMFAIDEAGAGGEILTTVSTIPYTSVTGLTAGSVTFGGATGLLAQDNANLFWDDTNNRLGIGTAAPAYQLETSLSQNNNTQIVVNNQNLGNNTGAVVRMLVAGSNTSTAFTSFGSGVANSGGVRGLGGYLVTEAGMTGGLTIGARNVASGEIRFYTAGTADANQRLTITNTGNVLLGSSTTASPGTGTLGLVFGDGTALSSMASNTAGLYANDVGGTVNMFAISEAGFTMQLTGAANDTLASTVQANITTVGALNAGSITSGFGAIDVGTDTITGGARSQSGKTTTYNAIATAGWGTPAVYGSGRSTAQVAAVASVATYTVGAADGSFIVSANVNVTTSTVHNFTVECAYTDETNTARTLTFTLSQLTGALVTAITNVTGAGPYEGLPMHIRCKASTAITIRTQAAGTYTTVTYNVEGSIEQVA